MTVLSDRFWSKVEKTETCWIWIAGKSGVGYGIFHIGGKSFSAHRLSFEAANGPIPDGKNIDHRCHNRSCVNPSHLRAVTQKQNCEHRKSVAAESKSGVRGVSPNRTGKKWNAKVTHRGRQIYVGTFERLEDAEAAAIAKRNELFTHNDLDRIPA